MWISKHTGKYIVSPSRQLHTMSLLCNVCPMRVLMKALQLTRLIEESLQLEHGIWLNHPNGIVQLCDYIIINNPSSVNFIIITLGYILYFPLATIAIYFLSQAYSMTNLVPWTSALISSMAKCAKSGILKAKSPLFIFSIRKEMSSLRCNYLWYIRTTLWWITRISCKSGLRLHNGKETLNFAMWNCMRPRIMMERSSSQG